VQGDREHFTAVLPFGHEAEMAACWAEDNAPTLHSFRLLPGPTFSKYEFVSILV